MELSVDLSRAKDFVVVQNHLKDPNYAPYCLRCIRAVRMTVIEPFLWKHHCGAVHDERQVLVVVAGATHDLGGNC